MAAKVPSDIEIAQACKMKPIVEIAGKLGLQADEYDLHGKYKATVSLSVRDRRLVTMGIIAALGEANTFCIQVRSAVKNGELTPEQVREMVMHIAQYAGYPRAAGLLMPVEETLAKLKG